MKTLRSLSVTNALRIVTPALVLLLVTGCATTDETYQTNTYQAFDAWDTDNDGDLEEEEFNEAYGNLGFYGDWDADGNAELDDNEFNEGLYGTWDANDDNAISEAEWNRGTDMMWGTDYDYNFDDWDEDSDGEIDADEFDAGVDDYGMGAYDTWDANRDEVITQEEFGSGVYNTWDYDGDGLIDENEWNDWASPWY